MTDLWDNPLPTVASLHLSRASRLPAPGCQCECTTDGASQGYDSAGTHWTNWKALRARLAALGCPMAAR
jgi:hypothetical protein